jgi:glutathione S-transferase
MKKPTLIYFKARGRAEVVRLLLAEAGVDYDEHPIGKDLGPWNGKPTDFAELKASGLLPYQAAPVWEDADGFRLAQSGAIAKYVAASHGMGGKSVRDEALIDQMLGCVDDVRGELRRLVATEPEKRPAFAAELASTFLPRWMGFLDRTLAANRDGQGFVVGESITVADFALFYLLEQLRDNGFGAPIDAHPRLVAFAKRIAERPRIAAYLASPSRPAFIPFPR